MSGQGQGRPQRPPRTSGGGLPVGRFFGVPMFFAPSWLIVALIITVSYSDVVSKSVDNISQAGAYAVSFGFAVLLALSLLAHELGHTAVSLALGTPVRRVVIFLLGGVSEIEKEPTQPAEEYLVAVAGPLVSLALAGLGGCLLPLATEGTVAWAVLSLLIWSNLAVAIFNLLPGLPLDGGRLLRAAVWWKSRSRLTGTRAAAWGGRGVAGLVLLIGAVTIQPEDGLAFGNLALAVLLATFIWIGASQSLTAATVTSRLPGLRLAQLIRPALQVPPDLPIAEALRRAWQTGTRALVVVDSTSRPRAVVSEAHVMAVPEARRPWTPVADVARPVEPGLTLTDSLTGEQLLDALRQLPASEYLVVGRDGGVVGVLAAVDVARVLQQGRMPSGAPA
ncbi:MAG TPA: site-2 protease family protein [Mycobacteriales bacterium]|nr:site-2 protease family protein [Mycobacteriales bacterium]